MGPGAAERKLGDLSDWLIRLQHSGDLWESPVVGMLEQLIGKGRDLRVCDRRIQMDKIYGSCRDYITSGDC
jgi:hypothetical protein